MPVTPEINLYGWVKDQDPEVYAALLGESQRQAQGIEVIPSENYVSAAVMQAMGSCFTNKYAEGYPGRRYYGGQKFVNQVERLAITRLCSLFRCVFANVQPHSGASANDEMYRALLKPGDTVLGMDLSHGGHLTHGHPVTYIAGNGIYRFVRYKMANIETGEIDYDGMRAVALREKPQIILAGFSAYPRELDYRKFVNIAREVGAYAVMDAVHIAGLIAEGVARNPFDDGFDVITAPSHKTLRGPHGGLIMTNDPALAKRIDQAVFPGSQGGPLVNMIAAKAVAFGEAQHPNFAVYAKRTLDNAKVMATVFAGEGIRLITGGTSNHLILADVWGSLGITGQEAETVLDEVGITLNKNVIADDERRPLDPSGIRFGTPAITTRGFGERECSQVAQLMVDVMRDRSEARRAAVRSEIQMLCERFPIPDSFV